MTDLSPKDRGVAMVFQNIALFPHMDVYDNISFGLRHRKYDQEQIETRVERAAEVVGLEGMMDRMLDEMSGGQRQRVAIARAIVRCLLPKSIMIAALNAIETKSESFYTAPSLESSMNADYERGGRRRECRSPSVSRPRHRRYHP